MKSVSRGVSVLLILVAGCAYAIYDDGLAQFIMLCAIYVRIVELEHTSRTR